MKIGAYLNYTEPRSGGGYTIEDDILRALIELAAESRHFFVILNWEEYPRSVVSSSRKFQFVNLANLRREQVNKRVSTRLAQVYNKIASRIPGIPLLSRGRLSWIEQVVRELGLDIIWNVTHHGIYPSNIPFIATVWDLQHRLQPWFPEVSAEGRWHGRERRLCHLIQASCIIVGTEAGKSEVINFYRIPPERIKLIPHPTPTFALNASQHDQREDNEQVLDKYNIPSGYLFYPAQFWSHKNHVNLLLAVRLLRDSYGIVFPVVFVGSDLGNQQHVRRVVKQLDLDNQVYFLGFVSQENLVSLYRNAFVLTYVTFFGPENLPPLEAFALGCPVIASNVSGAQEQLGDAALLVDPKDEKQIASAVKLLHDDPTLRQTLVARGTARASRWTGQDFVRAVFAILDEFEPIRRCWSGTRSDYIPSM